MKHFLCQKIMESKRYAMRFYFLLQKWDCFLKGNWRISWRVYITEHISVITYHIKIPSPICVTLIPPSPPPTELGLFLTCGGGREGGFCSAWRKHWHAGSNAPTQLQYPCSHAPGMATKKKERLIDLLLVLHTGWVAQSSACRVQGGCPFPRRHCTGRSQSTPCTCSVVRRCCPRSRHTQLQDAGPFPLLFVSLRFCPLDKRHSTIDLVTTQI